MRILARERGTWVSVVAVVALIMVGFAGVSPASYAAPADETGQSGDVDPKPEQPKETKAAKPTISGTVEVGKTLTAKTPGWTAGTTFKYQWFTGSGDSKKAITKPTTTNTLKLTKKYLGSKITVEVTGTQSGFTTVTKSATSKKKVVLGTLKSAKPSISGKRKVGSRLIVDVKKAKWTKGTKFSYQWLADGKAIKGATKNNYLIPRSMLGKTISVKVKGKLSGYESVTKSVSKSKPVIYNWKTSTGTQPKLSKYKAKDLRIDIKTGEQRVYVKAKDKKTGKYKVIYEMIASTGLPNTPTKKGTFRIGNRGSYFINAKYASGGRYWVQFTGDYLFHTVPINSKMKYIPAEAAKLGKPASHGCVRLSVADAKWLYKEVPRGVRVKVT